MTTHLVWLRNDLRINDNNFIRRWLPELAAVPDNAIQDPHS
jgi:deoxyribodipyrimidine photolyase